MNTVHNYNIDDVISILIEKNIKFDQVLDLMKNEVLDYFDSEFYWDLQSSFYFFGKGFYITFKDVEENMVTVYPVVTDKIHLPFTTELNGVEVVFNKK